MKITENRLRHIIREEIRNLTEGSIYEDRDKSSYETLAKLLKLRGLNQPMIAERIKGEYRLVVGEGPYYAVLEMYTTDQPDLLLVDLMPEERIRAVITQDPGGSSSHTHKVFRSPGMKEVAKWIEKELSKRN